MRAQLLTAPGQQLATAEQGRQVYAFTRPGDAAAQNFARGLGAE